MGIKHLWSILTPFGERKPLYELQGKTVAIDLSCWICEAQNVTDYHIQPKMYLRNLYFRTCYLLLMEVNPVFVLDGKAPELKYNTIAARNALQFKGAKPKTGGSGQNGKDRTRFKFVLQRCEEMLKYMGLKCIKGNGEAEALCAYLNEDKLVDGCISQDSDCFAYGAKVVYKNFSISQQGPHAASGGSIEVYDIQKVTNAINIGRNKIIALAVLCGSDYNNCGVYGIGKEAAIKLFEHVDDVEILSRLRSWRTNVQFYDELYKKLSDKNVCTSCGHFGKVTSHTKLGCLDCNTKTGCDFRIFKEKRLEIKNEVSMRSKALVDPNFPNEELLQEFIDRKDKVDKIDVRWRKPDLINFVTFATKHLQWDPLYTFQKCLPILTRWQLTHFQDSLVAGRIYPDRIKKIRKPKGVASYEIIWSDSDNYYKDVVPATHLVDQNLESIWTTIEPQELVRTAYPNLVDAFEESKKPKKATKRTKKQKNIEEMLANTSITDSPKPKRIRKKTTKSTNTIESYFKKAVLNNFENKNKSINHDLSKFGDEDDLDVSDIIEDIISRKPTYIEENLRMLGYCSTPKKKTFAESSFFITSLDEEDLFEKSMHLVEDVPNSDSSCDENEVEENDTFSEEYVPLLTRLKAKSS